MHDDDVDVIVAAADLHRGERGVHHPQDPAHAVLLPAPAPPHQGQAIPHRQGDGHFSFIPIVFVQSDYSN